MHATLPAVLAATLVAALPLAPASQEQQDDAAVAVAAGLLPAATQQIEIPENRDLSLADLVDSLAQSTGLRFVVSSSTRQFLNDTPCGLLSGGVILPGEVYPFVESVLKRHRVVFQRLAGDDVPVAALYALDGGGRDAGALGWSSVSADQIDAVANHHSLLVQCSLDVFPADARQMVSAARSMIRDSNYQNIISLGQSSMVVRGTGNEVAEMIQIFRLAAESEKAVLEAREAERQRQMEQQQGGAGGGR